MQYPLLNRTLKPIPKYPERILQFGGGNFLRAFTDWIVHEMNHKVGFKAGVVVVQSINMDAVDAFNAQDGLYTVCLTGIENGQAAQECVLVDCIRRSLSPYRDMTAFLETAHNPDLRFIFSNTTEAGIVFDENDRQDDTPPHSFPAKLTQLLYERFRFFDGDTSKGLILLPCELIHQNGAELKSIIQQYIELWKLPAAFSTWIAETCIFCNTLVDRIVPGFPESHIDEFRETLGYEDQLLTEGERFHLWVIEGPPRVAEEFPAREAGLNVIFTDDLTPYRTRKVRILNGAHSSMVPVGYLYGLRTVREAVEDEGMGKFITRLIYEEIIPTLDLPEAELQSFAADVLDRFRNPYIEHHLISIALNATSKFKTRILPSLLTYFERKGALPRRIVLAMAATIRFYRGRTLEGSSIPLKDDPERIDFFRRLWEERGENLPALVKTVLAREDFWGQDLNQIPDLAGLLTAYLHTIETRGMQEAVTTLEK